MSLDSITTLEGYLSTYGNIIGKQAQEKLRPLHTPGVDQPFSFARMKRRPYEAQSHVMSATVKALRRDRVLFMACQQGAGKSLMSIGVVDELRSGRPYRAIVMVPPHLTAKWEREIRRTLSGVRVIQLRDVSQLMSCDRGEKPDCAEWWIVKENAAKTGAEWRASYLTNRRGACLCTGCMKPIADKEGIPIAPDILSTKMMNHEFSYEGEEVVEGCGDHLWTYCRSEYDRASWAIAKYARTHLKKYFDVFISDEVHENRSEVSARATAMGQLAAASKKCLGLTGTFAGGYAWQIRSLLMRLCPGSLLSENFTWTNVTKFNEIYGKIETKTTTKESEGSDNRRSQGKTTKRTNVRPGIMPTLFGRHLIDKCVFMSLDELSNDLPNLHQEAIAIDMDDECANEYKRIEEALRKAVKELMRRGNRQLLGAMLRVLLTYPDHPYGFDVIKYINRGLDHNNEYLETEVEVVTPEDLSEKKIRNKQLRLIQDIKKEKREGRQCWVYVQDTNKYDIQPRLKELIEAEGLTCKILRSTTVKTEDREEWIGENGPECDVIISHPQLVQTGLDLFDIGGSYNFPTLMFYQTGYELYVLRQAAARALRIGQTLDCKVLYYYYAHTMQQQALNLMGKKLVAAEAIEGKFTAEGLAAMTGEDESIEIAMAKALIRKIDDADVVRSWGRFSMQKASPAKSKEDSGERAVQFVTDDGVVITKIPNVKKIMRSLFS